MEGKSLFLEDVVPGGWTTVPLEGLTPRSMHGQHKQQDRKFEGSAGESGRN